MSYDCLLFDADGTLFDYDTAEVAAVADNFAAFDLAYHPTYGQRYQLINNLYWQRFERQEVTLAQLRTGRFQQLLEELALQVDIEAFANSYLTQLAKQAHLFDGAAELIQALHGRYQLCLITNGLAEVQYPRLERSGLRPYFQAVIVSDEVGVGKPSPTIFEVAFAHLGYPAKEKSLIIGDSLTSDIQGGYNYGIDTCWLNRHAETAVAGLPITYEITDLCQLEGILNQPDHATKKAAAQPPRINRHY